MRRIWVLAVLVPVVVSLSGCILLAVGAGATGVVWWKGEASKSYPYAVEKTYNAAVKALEANNIVIYSKGADATSGKIEATLADGKKLKINLAPESEGVTKVKVRIGTWGDKDRSLFIFGEIEKRL